MAQAIWNDVVLAESDACHLVDGHYYFPPESVRHEFLRPSRMFRTCRWKGVARYSDVVVNGKVNCKAAWHYPQPNDAARQIQNYVAFWHGVKVANRTVRH
jgi:uncharacterized protein (DUF427 family)